MLITQLIGTSDGRSLYLPTPFCPELESLGSDR